jgi:hypothetical protein
MPVVLRSGPYRFFFYSDEGAEPPHIHVDRAEATAKFWLKPPRLARNNGFPRHELTRIRKLVTIHQEQLLRSWHEHFDN